MRTKIIICIAAILVFAGGVGAWFWLQGRSDGPPAGQDKTSTTPSIQLVVSGLDDSQLTRESSLQVEVESTSPDQIVRVEFYIDDKLITYSTRPPFAVTLSLDGLALGEHRLQAAAYGMQGGIGRSDIFRFVINESQSVEPADEASAAIVSGGALAQSQSGSLSTGSSSGGQNNSQNEEGGGNNGGGGGGDPDPDPDPGDTTPWPDEPPALICGNSSILNGPSSPPMGAVVVAAGNNNAVDFEQPNTIYWFAPGTHTIGTDPLSQIIPGDNSTFVGAPGAVLDGQNINQYAFTQHGQNVTIQNLTIINFETPQNEGTVNHDSGEGWLIEYNTIQNNGGGGVFGGTDNVVRYNCLKDNGQYGFQVYSGLGDGPENVTIDHNEVAGNNQDDWETQIEGCGCTGGGKFWDADNVDVTNNYVHDNLSVGLWADTNDNDFLIEGNYIEDNLSQGLFYEISYNMIVRNNFFIGNGVIAGPDNPGFPTAAIYLSEAGGDSRVPARTDKIEIYDNKFVDNWSGIVLWENADRFCASPSNTSTGVCTLVNPSVATLANCTDPANGGSVDEEPYYSDCRWKTQNVRVHDNTFEMDRDSIPNCTTNTACGFQGIFSNVGTSPSWSPYMGEVIQEDITFNQNNLFHDNTYIGDWYFKAKAQDRVYNFAIWQNAPFLQDNGSLFNGEDHLTVTNALDANTATLEGGTGLWVSWFSTTIARTTTEAHGGSYSLQVNITAPFGWGVELSNPAGFPVTPLDKNISFWAKTNSGAGLGATLELGWQDEDQNLLRTDTVTLSSLTSSWQEATASITPPVGVATVRLSFTHSSGTNGNALYLDDIVVGDVDN